MCREALKGLVKEVLMEGQEERYIVSFMEDDGGMQLCVTNGLDRLFMLPMDLHEMNKHRQKTGIEGSWQAYFSLLRQALDTSSLTLESEQVKDTHTFLLRIHYPLLPGACITGTFDLSPHEIRGRSRHEIL